MTNGNVAENRQDRFSLFSLRPLCQVFGFRYLWPGKVLIKNTPTQVNQSKLRMFISFN